MDLPRGITGFFRWDDPLPLCDFAGFRGHCYAAARLAGGKVTSTANANECRIACNFVYATMDLPTVSAAVLLNIHFPLVAFAEAFADRQLPLRFLDVPELASGFREFGVYQVLTTDDLEQRVFQKDLPNLTKGELKKVKYFKPKTIGEIVFNFWD